jgi:regulator of sigma E protease
MLFSGAIALVTMIVVLGIMIVVHEFGHYAVAKLCGVRVLVFSVGFGKRLLGFTKGGTDYRISALPFGGYVKMAGENPMEEHHGDPGEFMSHPRWQRILIALAGPAMNILLAIGIVTALLMYHYEYSPVLSQSAVVGMVDSNSPAAKADIRIGDRILRFGDRQDPKWDDEQEILLQAKIDPGAPIDITLQRGSEVLTKHVVPEDKMAQEPPYLGIFPEGSTAVTTVEPDMPAAAAGIREGDQIRSMDGEPMLSMTNVVDHIQKTAGKPVTMEIVREGKQFEATATPVMKNGRLRLGFGLGYPVVVTRLAFGPALSESINKNIWFSGIIVRTIGSLVRSRISIKSMDGPIGIGREAGKRVEQGAWLELFELMAMISINLGIFNLMPIPILDGGLIAITLFESVIRRDIDQQVKERIYQTAFVMIIIFAVVVFYNDIAKMLPISHKLP